MTHRLVGASTLDTPDGLSVDLTLRIWINRQSRICFTWSGDLGPTDVEIVDYH